MLLQACYGVVMRMDDFDTTFLKAIDTNGEEIPELRISYQNKTYTSNWEA